MTLARIDYSGGQDIGRRESQQDAYMICDRGKQDHVLFLLADGMGGHVSGELAAKLAIESFARGNGQSFGPCHEAFDRCLDQSNRAIASEIEKNPEHDGMGCTFVALEMIGSHYSWISIGDSPLFLIRDGTVRRINADHSMASRLDAAAKRGDITYEEARTSPNRHALLYALTGEPLSRIDWQRQAQTLLPGDWLILASDGLESLSTDEIATVVARISEQKAAHICKALLAAVTAKEVRHQDNVTVIAISLDPAGQALSADQNAVVTRPIRVGR